VSGRAGGTEEEPLLISGVVVDAAGRPVADARVALAAAPVEVPDIAALTGEDGGFSIRVPVTGSYRVAAYGDQERAEETVDVDQGRGAQVRLVLRP
jgi:Carboxypeptidase regulatory-like domain